MPGLGSNNQARTFFLIVIFVFGVCATEAKESLHSRSSSSKSQADASKAAGCTPSTHRVNLEFNNVRALIETGGNMWQTRSSRSPAYEVPKTADNSGPKAIFAGSLWIGGKAIDNNLKLAAVRFRAIGNDYWPGPLSTDGAATVEGDVCEKYDRTWSAYKSDAEIHKAFHLCKNDPSCNESLEFPNYTTPSYFYDWPAHGDISQGQDYYLAPFGEVFPDQNYDPDQGDYPGYKLDGILDCRTRDRESPIPLYGDHTIWWVFNDKGNVHSESGGLPIGMEIRAQAFAYSTNDQVNNMTFYNYTLINQGTQVLLNTYFGQWVDSDLGYPEDDFVGCDVRRGLGYSYNGDPIDESGTTPGYGSQPPAIGVDFFEGPFQDYDQLDNPLTTNVQDALDSDGIPYDGIGIGYGDSVVDNERLGMRAFLYHNNDQTVTGDPETAIQYYNYLQGVWKDNSDMYYGGTGHQNSQYADQSRPCRYMFPGDSDPYHWGTGGEPTSFHWTEENIGPSAPSGNNPADRRFIQSAGPFKLEPGAYNNVTVGVVYARATQGQPFASVRELRIADDKAQELFNSCFEILDGPTAPLVTAQELDRELILYLSNPSGNNVGEDYAGFDPSIPESYLNSDSILVQPDRQYRFQGYEVYQLEDESVGIDEIGDVDRARLVHQGDLKDGIAQIVNFVNDPQLGLAVPTEMVDGTDDGIIHAIKVNEDLFAQGGDPRLVNFKTYYFLAVAYAYNNWKAYEAGTGTGQAHPYLRGRMGSFGAIRPIAVIPHKPAPELGGTIQNSAFGDGFEITRIEGHGNGSQAMDLSRSSVDDIVSGPPWFQQEITYKSGAGPIDVSVIDPLNVPATTFEIGFKAGTSTTSLNDATWYIQDMNTGQVVWSDETIAVGNEQLFIGASNNWGISVRIDDYELPRIGYVEPLGIEVEIAEPDKVWFRGIPDFDGETSFNWIRAGVVDETTNLFNDYLNKDPDELYEALTEGTWAPWALAGDGPLQPGSVDTETSRNLASISRTPSIEVVLTPDESKWTRCAVLEIADLGSEHGDEKLTLRSDQSVGKDGLPDNTGTGMGWFPGYTVNIGTGERLNMAFGEDSFLAGTTGRDMIWNPSDTIALGPFSTPIMGGGHWIYVFNNNQRIVGTDDHMPLYDKGEFMHSKLATPSVSNKRRVFRSCAWVGSAALLPGAELLATETRIRLNVAAKYLEFEAEPYAGYTPVASDSENAGLPLYRFTTGTASTLTQNTVAAQDACELIQMVPNPYYAWSCYDTGRLDNRVKFTNLPEECRISIYNVSGTLVRKYKKDNALTYLDWNLRNENNVPIAGGLYICHIQAPNECERVVKWFGALRPSDLSNF